MIYPRMYVIVTLMLVLSSSIHHICTCLTGNKQNVTNGAADLQQSYDPFSMSAVAQAIPPAQFNPYLEDNASITGTTAAYYGGQNTYATAIQPVRILN